MKARVHFSASGMGVAVAVAVLGAACTTDEGPVDPAPAACAPAAYRIAAVTLPRSGAGAAQLALDLDDDGVTDNRLGRLHATLAASFADWRPDERLSARLAGGELGWFVTVTRCEGAVAVDLVEGHDPDGDGRYQLAPGGDAAIGDDRLARDGAAELPLLGFTDPLGLTAAPGWVTARGVAIAVRAGGAPDQLDAVAGVGIELGDDALAPVAEFLTRHLGDSLIARALDADRDRIISVAELRASPTIAALIAPDVDVASADGVPDRISLAFGLHAVAVAIE